MMETVFFNKLYPFYLQILIDYFHNEMQKFMNKLAARFIRPTVIQDLQKDKNSFSTVDVSLFNQKDDMDLHIGLVAKQKLRKLMEEDIGNPQVELFYNNECEFYKTAYMYWVKWLS